MNTVLVGRSHQCQLRLRQGRYHKLAVLDRNGTKAIIDLGMQRMRSLGQIPRVHYLIDGSVSCLVRQNLYGGAAVVDAEAVACHPGFAGVSAKPRLHHDGPLAYGVAGLTVGAYRAVVQIVHARAGKVEVEVAREHHVTIVALGSVEVKDVPHVVVEPALQLTEAA